MNGETWQLTSFKMAASSGERSVRALCTACFPRDAQDYVRECTPKIMRVEFGAVENSSPLNRPSHFTGFSPLTSPLLSLSPTLFTPTSPTQQCKQMNKQMNVVFAGTFGGDSHWMRHVMVGGLQRPERVSSTSRSTRAQAAGTKAAASPRPHSTQFAEFGNCGKDITTVHREGYTFSSRRLDFVEQRPLARCC